MQVLLAHAGHGHGPDPALVALLAAVLVLGFVAAGAAVRRARARRTSA